MRPLIFILLVFFNYSLVTGQTGQDIFYNEIKFFLNEKGESLTRAEFEKVLKTNASKYHRWDQIENDSIRIARLIPKKETFNVSYPDIYKILEGVTESKFAGNPVFIIHYNYYNDLCSPASGFNYWNTLRVRRNKRISDNLVRRIESEFPNVIALHFFEPGITIEPSQILKKYFYIDQNRFFLRTLFKIPSSCGSVAIILPGGDAVIFNGPTPIPELADSVEN